MHRDEEWELDECVSECDRQGSNTQNDVVKAEVHKRKGRGSSSSLRQDQNNQIWQSKDQEVNF